MTAAIAKTIPKLIVISRLNVFSLKVKIS